MPVFEYRCSDCSRKFVALVGVTSDSSEPACPKCGGSNLRKLISRFSRGKGEDEMLDSFEDAALGANPDDPKSVSRLMRQMGKELAEDGEDDFDEYVEEAEREIYDGPTEGSEDGDF